MRPNIIPGILGTRLVLGGEATCSEGFVNSFLRVPQAVGLYTEAAMLPKQAGGGGLLENILQNLRNKWPPHPVEFHLSNLPPWLSLSMVKSKMKTQNRSTLNLLHDPCFVRLYLMMATLLSEQEAQRRRPQ